MKLSLKTTHPELFAQIHPTLNKNVDFDSLSSGSGRKLWWVGECGHEWEARLQSRTSQGSGCPYCAGNKVLPGFNDLATTNPELVGEWHPTKNGNLTPTTVPRGSRKKVWWQCDKGHEWEASLDSRGVQGSGCPYCSGNKAFEKYNDLATTNPEIAQEWHPTKNGNLTPTKVSAGSHQKIWWEGKCGHEWEAEIASRVAGKGCPYCSGRSVLPGFNDVKAKAPAVALEWHLTKNGDLKPEDVLSGSHKRIWWQCDKGHEWEAVAYSRTAVKNNRGCPQCWANSFVSKAEALIYAYVCSLLPEGTEILQSSRELLKGQELDIYIPSKRMAIEFNGLFWHTEKAGKHRTYHHDKWLKCKEKGVQLIQIWEDDWNRNPEQVKRMLAHKLGVSQERKVFARKTSVVEVSKARAEQFLNENHIQGYSSGSYYLGLRDNDKDDLVAVLVVKNEAGTDGKTLNIIRYATSCNVVGGFTKLLKHAEHTYQPESFITFADHCVSDGGLYENNGFVADKILPPDYMYVVGVERKHKFGYRLKKFRDDPSLLWEEGLTERELAELNGLERIWDAGKTRYRYIV